MLTTALLSLLLLRTTHFLSIVLKINASVSSDSSSGLWLILECFINFQILESFQDRVPLKVSHLI